jgi:hypothetical protein
VPVRFTGNDLRGNGSQGQDERSIVVRMDSEHVECREVGIRFTQVTPTDCGLAFAEVG